MASVTIRDVWKSVGTVWVIHGVDIDVSDGACVVFVGPSGVALPRWLGIAAGGDLPERGS